MADPSVLALRADEARRFAELSARTGLEPELAQRYANDPVSVLAEFGLTAAEPLYLGADDDSLLLIEDLDPGNDLLLEARSSFTITTPALQAR
ncbi:hypothetical protein [Peterkaempfera griseoplana]|uniref:hypothetical protein n=1 Tax=Peterkaempfera griseoplana TaxID=66896 RepID=UPI0012FF41E3|nr:hypothetical protein [Peterkaempfera griseoplana]